MNRFNIGFDLASETFARTFCSEYSSKFLKGLMELEDPHFAIKKEGVISCLDLATLLVTLILLFDDTSWFLSRLDDI